MSNDKSEAATSSEPTIDDDFRLVVKYRLTGPNFGVISGRALFDKEAILGQLIQVIPRQSIMMPLPSTLDDEASSGGGSLSGSIFAPTTDPRPISDDTSNYYNPNGEPDPDEQTDVHVRITARGLSGRKIKVDRWVSARTAHSLLTTLHPSSHVMTELWSPGGAWVSKTGEAPSVSQLDDIMVSAAQERRLMRDQQEEMDQQLAFAGAGVGVLFSGIAAHPEDAESLIKAWKQFVVRSPGPFPFYQTDQALVDDLVSSGEVPSEVVDGPLRDHVYNCASFLRSSAMWGPIAVGQMYSPPVRSEFEVEEGPPSDLAQAPDQNEG